MIERISGFLAQVPTSPAPTSPAPTQPSSTGGQQACGDLGGLIPLFIILFGIMYVFMILPQRRREKQRQRMISALKKNDHIVTIGGVYGVITGIRDDRITIIDDNKNVKLTVTPSAMASVRSTEKEEGEKEEGQDKQDK